MEYIGMPCTEGSTTHRQGYDGRVFKVGDECLARQRACGAVLAHAGPGSDHLESEDALVCFSISCSSSAWMWANSRSMRLRLSIRFCTSASCKIPASFPSRTAFS